MNPRDLFLRKIRSTGIGNVINNMEVSHGSYLHDYIGDQGLMIFVISTSCSSCLPALNDLADAELINYIDSLILLACDDDEYDIINETLGKKFKIIRNREQTILRELKAPGVPWFFYVGVDKVIRLSNPYRTYSDMAQSVQMSIL